MFVPVFKQMLFKVRVFNVLMMLSLIVQKAVTGVVAVSEIHMTSYSNNSICYGDTVNHQTIPVTYLWSADP